MKNNLVEKIKEHREDTYQQFVEKYGKRIDERLEEVFVKNKNTCWSKGVYQEEKGLLKDIYWDTELNGGRFNNLLRYCKEQGFSTSARYWCGGSCTDADGFVITV